MGITLAKPLQVTIDCLLEVDAGHNSADPGWQVARSRPGGPGRGGGELGQLTKAAAACQLGISRTILYKLIGQRKVSTTPDSLID
jgi:hypothetical protein